MALDGTWTLEVLTPFGRHPGTLKFERNGGALGGTVNSNFGGAQLLDLNASDDAFDASISIEVQGRTYTARIFGQAYGDQISGTIKTQLAIIPAIKYTGTRAR